MRFRVDYARMIEFLIDQAVHGIVVGGKSPAIVFEDAEYLDSVAERVVHGRFWNIGENCTGNYWDLRFARILQQRDGTYRDG